MSAIVLNKIALSSQTVTYNFSVPNALRNHINPNYITQDNNCTLFIELPNGVSAEEIPEAVLSIPFIGTMLGVAMLYQIPIKVKDVDANYFESIKKIETIFKKMYSKGNLNLIVESERITEVKASEKEPTTSVFFTGGVDATSALIEVIDKMPLLINIAGGDIALSNQKAHENLKKYFQLLKKEIDGLDYCFVKSNCREFFREYTFDKICKKFIARELWWGYWASIAHIVVMTAIIAPTVYSKNITRHYIGSSHSSQDSAFDGNNEELINAISYGNCKFISADADLDRNDKVKKIVDYSRNRHVNFKLQVCWQKKEGLNCCECEKCYRTMMNILSAHGDPNKFGLRYDGNKMREIKSFLETTPIKLSYWTPTQSVFKTERGSYKDTELEWFVDFKFNRPKTYMYKALTVLKSKLKI